MNDRDQILTAIRDALTRNRASLDAMARSAPHVPPGFVHAAEADLVAQFAAEIERLHARAYHCGDEAAAYDIIGRIIEKHAVRNVLVWDERFIGLGGFDAWLQSRGVARADARLKPCATATTVAQDTPVAQDFSPADRQAALQAIEPIPLGITGADVAIAESGTVVVVGGAGRPRLASLLAPAHIAVVHASQIVRGLGDALVRLRDLYGTTIFDNTSSLTFITGPSRTADIELTLTLGVHGPREVHIVIIDPSLPSTYAAG